MKSLLVGVLVAVLFVVMTLLMFGGYVVSTLNADSNVKNLIAAQEETRNLYFDKLYKVIAQKTQITNASSEQQKELVEALVQGREGGFVRIVNEANPESAFSREQFTDLSNTVEAQREGFFREQKKLVDLVRENHSLHDRVLSGVVLSMFSREKVESPTLITSQETENVISSGQDNNIELGLE